jgi:hypothetical protein
MSNCTCHSIRERNDGVTYSLYMLGVQCGHCEAINDAYQQQEWWNSLSDKETVAERWSWAVSRVSYSWQRRPMRSLQAAHWRAVDDAWGEPPF